MIHSASSRAVLALGFLAGVLGSVTCTPEYRDCVFVCGAHGACPSGLSCSNGYCTRGEVCEVDGSSAISEGGGSGGRNTGGAPGAEVSSGGKRDGSKNDASIDASIDGASGASDSGTGARPPIVHDGGKSDARISDSGSSRPDAAPSNCDPLWSFEMDRAQPFVLRSDDFKRDWGALTFSPDRSEFFFARGGHDGTIAYLYQGKYQWDGFGDLGVGPIYDDGDAGHPFEGTEPALSLDGRTLYFSLNNDIYFATRRSRDRPFETPTPLDIVNSPEGTEGSPFVSADGNTLYFDTDRNQDFDIYQYSLHTTRAPEPVRGLAEKADHEMSPILTEDELTVYFASSYGNSNSNRDMWMARRESKDRAFDQRVALKGDAPQISYNRYPQYLTPDGCTLYYDSGLRSNGGPWMIKKKRP